MLVKSNRGLRAVWSTATLAVVRPDGSRPKAITRKGDRALVQVKPGYYIIAVEDDELVSYLVTETGLANAPCPCADAALRALRVGALFVQRRS
jgi:hypothetical protein